MSDEKETGNEVAKRLAIKSDVLRELYLKSGNQCAFPGCGNVIMDSDGKYVGQLCHIEAAEEGGERFNTNMNNEERRAFSNLLLLCYTHHVVTNDVGKYPPPDMKQMKADHEAKFTDVVAKIEEAIRDHTVEYAGLAGTSLNKLNDVLAWGHAPDELKVCVDEVEQMRQVLLKLPLPTRQLLQVAVSRLNREEVLHRKGMRYEYADRVLADEVALACDVEPQQVRMHMDLIEKYKLGYLDAADETQPPRIRLYDLPSGWFILADIREFCERIELPLRAVLVELRFDLLD